MNPTDEQFGTPRPSRRGQTMAEFALTLPILLMLMFGVIEFARIFQAWVTLQNAARAGARYAVTGQWDAEAVGSLIGLSGPGSLNEEQYKQVVLDALVPCTTGYDDAFARHWGKDCEPGDDDDQGLRVDMARLPGIVERARIGAAGLSLKDGDRYVGLQNASGDELNTETVADDQSGWFHVWICSSRTPIFNEEGVSTRYSPSEDRNNRLCELKEGANAGINQYDAGGPGDAVEIIVFFNHPLITPLGLVDYVQLQARRVMINESFRSTRVVNLPPQLGLPTFTPSNTPPPSNTPLPSKTPTATSSPTNTPSPPPTDTTTPTPTPDCSLITFVSARLVDNYLQIRIQNNNAWGPVFLTEASINWQKHTLFPSMYASDARITGRSPFWTGSSSTSPTVLNPSVTGWTDTPPNYLLTRFDANATTTFQIGFANGPSRLDNYLTLGQFNGSSITLARTWGGVSGGPSPCTITISDAPTPTPVSQTPTRTPTPDCRNFEVNFVSFETNGVVHYSLRNTDVAIAYITGFTINWNTYGRSLPPINLDFVSVRGTGPFDPATIIIWDGNVTSPPAVAASGGSGWLVNAVVEPQQTVDIWIDLDGTSSRLDTGLGYDESDFNGTSFVLNFICNGTQDQRPTPQNTLPPTATFTPSITFTPSKTNTPGPTKTPTPVTPSKTPTKTYTPAPVTDTPTRTPLPTNTPFGAE